jgi:hypothetical protein
MVDGFCMLPVASSLEGVGAQTGDIIAACSGCLICGLGLMGDE